MIKRWLFLFFSWFLVLNSIAQQKEKEQKYRKVQEKLEQEIQFLNDEISRISKNVKNINEKAILVNKQLQLYEKYLSTVNKEILQISDQIQEKNNLIFQLEQNIELLRVKLKALLKIIYVLRSPSTRLAFLFSSGSIQATYKKYLYINQVKQKIIKHIQHLREKINFLQKEKEDLLILQEEKLSTQNKLLSSIEKYQQLLQEQSKLKAEARKKEKELRQQLEMKKKEKEKINQKIQNLIASSTKTSQPKNKPSSPVQHSRSSIHNKASVSSFLDLKGKLLWPVEGTVVGYFGEQSHPLLEDIKYKNNGIDILCKNNSTIRAVYDGMVTQVIPIDNDNYLIIIRHDDFLTVYTQLTEVHVTPGTTVSTNTPLGSITKKENSVLHFEIWHEKTPLNPLDWLKK